MAFVALVYVDDHTAGAIRAGDAPWEGSARTVGLFRYPSKSEIGCPANCKNTGWSRHAFGFMKCAGCGQRNKNIRRFVINALFDHLGANLIIDPPQSFRTPDGYGDRAING